MNTKLSEEMDNLLVHETGLLKRKFSDPRNDDPLCIMRELAGKDPVQILTSVFEACMKYFPPFHRAQLNDFIQSTLQNRTHRHMFLLAIYKGAYSAAKLFPSFFEESTSYSSTCYPGDATGNRNGQGKSEGKYRASAAVYRDCVCGSVVVFLLVVTVILLVVIVVLLVVVVVLLVVVVVLLVVIVVFLVVVVVLLVIIVVLLVVIVVFLVVVVVLLVVVVVLLVVIVVFLVVVVVLLVVIVVLLVVVGVLLLVIVVLLVVVGVLLLVTVLLEVVVVLTEQDTLLRANFSICHQPLLAQKGGS